jgi:hypothetical protein
MPVSLADCARFKVQEEDTPPPRPGGPTGLTGHNPLTHQHYDMFLLELCVHFEESWWHHHGHPHRHTGQHSAANLVTQVTTAGIEQGQQSQGPAQGGGGAAAKTAQCQTSEELASKAGGGGGGCRPMFLVLSRRWQLLAMDRSNRDRDLQPWQQPRWQRVRLQCA